MSPDPTHSSTSPTSPTGSTASTTEQTTNDVAAETVAGYLARALPTYGVTHVFELVGGMITVLLDALHNAGTTRVVSMHHEQGAGFAAEGFSRMTGRPAVALATSGPGATNLLTAIGSCFFDSVPTVFITGQVNRSEQSRGLIGRQGGFQETDIVSVAGPLCKWVAQVEDPAQFPTMLDRAMHVATSGRPGPVLLDIPMDVQKLPVPRDSTPSLSPHLERTFDATQFDEFMLRLRTAVAMASRPLLLVGGGVQQTREGTEAVRKLVAAWGVPVVTSLMGLDAIPAATPERAGFIGSYGNRWANRAVAEADLLLVLGSRLDIRQTGGDISGFVGERAIFHVDVDAGELGTRVPGCDTLQADLVAVAQQLVNEPPAPPDPTWPALIRQWAEEMPDTGENVPVDDSINPNLALRQISEHWPEISCYVTDVGQHQMWAAQSLQLLPHQRFMTSGGMGAMGFGLPAAIGAALGASVSEAGPVCLIAGDGGFQLNIQELETLARTRVDVRIVVLDNACHGMVRQFQESYFDGRYHSTLWGYSRPDFVRVAAAYDLPAFAVDTHESLAQTLREVADTSGPCLIRIPVSAELNAYPKMAFGRPFGSMEPQSKPTAMEGT